MEWKTPPTRAPCPTSLLYSATARCVCCTVTWTPRCLTKSRVAEGTWRGHRSISSAGDRLQHYCRELSCSKTVFTLTATDRCINECTIAVHIHENNQGLCLMEFTLYRGNWRVEGGLIDVRSLSFKLNLSFKLIKTYYIVFIILYIYWLFYVHYICI